MHRFQSSSTITRLRCAAVLICLKWLLIPVVVGLLIYSLVIRDMDLTSIAAGLAGFTVLIWILQWILASRPRCPLCMTPVLAHKGCSKHRHAKTLLGSYRLLVATGILFKGSFRCPYCNEPSAMKVRDRSRSR